MRKVLFGFLALGVLLPLAAPAAAAPARRAPQKSYVKKTVFILEGSELLGTLVKPSGVWVSGPRRARLSSLIEYRSSFTPEMVKMTEAL